MRLTKFGHACVRVEHEGTTLVIDPGVFTEPEAVDGADAVLITHEHFDHCHAETLRRTDAPIHTIGAVQAVLRGDAPDVAERVDVVTPEQQLQIGSIPVRVVGEQHAVIHPDLPRFDNSGYLLTLGDQRVFHPGDALTGPGEPVDVLLTPVSAPWLKLSEAIDFARRVGAPRNLAIHDRVYSEAGLGIADGHFARLLDEGQDYLRLPDAADL